MRTLALGPFVLFQRAEFSTLHPDHMSLYICVAAYVAFKSLGIWDNGQCDLTVTFPVLPGSR